MKISKTDFIGTGKVFRFTLSQYVKNKANVITFVVLLLICALSVPLSGFVSDTDTSAPQGPDTLYIQNETDLPIHCSDELLLSFGFAETEIRTEDFEKIGKKDVMLLFAAEQEQLVCHIRLSDDSIFSDGDMSVYTSLCQKLITQAKYEVLGIDENIFSDLGNVPEISVRDFDKSDTSKDGIGAEFVLQYVYAIIVMMLTLLAASYIIRSVIEEKSSKLVELLMVSVKPLALLAGKILAMMFTVFITLLSMVASVLLSNYASVRFLNTPGIGKTLSALGIDFSSMNFGWETILLTLVCIFISYLTYSVLAGLAGSCCSAMEQADSANALVTVTIMLGYLASCVTSNIPSVGVAYFTSLCPVISAFCAPVQYAVGNIPLWVFLVSLLIQAAIAYFLTRLCAKVYHSLIMHKGNRIKWGMLLRLAKEDDTI